MDGNLSPNTTTMPPSIPPNAPKKKVGLADRRGQLSKIPKLNFNDEMKAKEVQVSEAIVEHCKNFVSPSHPAL